jgi:hexosaminidase
VATPIDKVYNFDPLPAELTQEQHQHILGAQGQLWSEYIRSTDHLEYMAFPRLIALAEVTWSPLAQRDFTSFRQRLASHETRLSHLNVAFRPIATWEQEQHLSPQVQG